MLFKNYIKNFIELPIIVVLKTILPKHVPKRNSILFINNGFIGDLIISSILCENDHLFSKYDKVIFVVKNQYKELFADYSGSIEFIGYNYKKYKYSLLYKYSFLKYLRSFGFGKVYNLTAARGIISEEITLLSGAEEKYCLNSDKQYLGKLIGKNIENQYNSIITLKSVNEYEKHFELLRFAFNNKNPLSIYLNKKTFKESDIQGKLNFILNNKYIVIAPFSLERYKDWPTKHFKKLIEYLEKKYIVVLIGNKDQSFDLIKLKDNFNNVHIAAGTLLINEIPSLISKAVMFVGLDSGITHMAVKLGIPTLSIIGGGQFNRFLPFGESQTVRYLYYKMNCFNCEWNCPFEKKDCIELVSVASVIDNIQQLLEFNTVI